MNRISAILNMFPFGSRRSSNGSSTSGGGGGSPDRRRQRRHDQDDDEEEDDLEVVTIVAQAADEVEAADRAETATPAPGARASSTRSVLYATEGAPLGQGMRTGYKAQGTRGPPQEQRPLSAAGAAALARAGQPLPPPSQQQHPPPQASSSSAAAAAAAAGGGKGRTRGQHHHRQLLSQYPGLMAPGGGAGIGYGPRDDDEEEDDEDLLFASRSAAVGATARGGGRGASRAAAPATAAASAAAASSSSQSSEVVELLSEDDDEEEQKQQQQTRSPTTRRRAAAAAAAAAASSSSAAAAARPDEESPGRSRRPGLRSDFQGNGNGYAAGSGGGKRPRPTSLSPPGASAAAAPAMPSPDAELAESLWQMFPPDTTLLGTFDPFTNVPNLGFATAHAPKDPLHMLHDQQQRQQQPAASSSRAGAAAAGSWPLAARASTAAAGGSGGGGAGGARAAAGGAGAGAAAARKKAKTGAASAAAAGAGKKMRGAGAASAGASQEADIRSFMPQRARDGAAATAMASQEQEEEQDVIVLDHDDDEEEEDGEVASSGGGKVDSGAGAGASGEPMPRWEPCTEEDGEEEGKDAAANRDDDREEEEDVVIAMEVVKPGAPAAAAAASASASAESSPERVHRRLRRPMQVDTAGGAAAAVDLTVGGPGSPASVGAIEVMEVEGASAAAAAAAGASGGGERRRSGRLAGQQHQGPQMDEAELFAAAARFDSSLTWLLKDAEDHSFIVADACLHAADRGDDAAAEAAAAAAAVAATAAAAAAAKASGSGEEGGGGGCGGGGGGGSGPSQPYQFSEVQLRDVAVRLLNDELLSDEILNRAVDMLARARQHTGHAVLFNTFWYEKIKDGRYAEARAWLDRALRGRDRRRVALVCVPVNISNTHWVLVFADLERGTVQEWDPASAEYCLDPSRVRNVQDMVEKALGDLLPAGRRLQVRPAPARLPQQADAINCGLFVVLFLIHLCMVRPRGPALLDDHDPSGQRRRSARLTEAAVAAAAAEDDGADACVFPTAGEDLFRYRLFLLAWILHSQTTQLPRTEPVLLRCVAEKPPVAADDGSVIQGGIEDVTTKAAKRRILLSVLRDDAAGGGRTRLLQVGMALLNRCSSGEVAFLAPSWYRAVAAGDMVAADEAMKGRVDVGRVVVLCAPCYLEGRGWVLARIELGQDFPAVFIHGHQATVRAVVEAETRALGGGPIGRFLDQFLREGGEWQWHAAAFAPGRVPQEHMAELALLLVAMEACRRGAPPPRQGLEVSEADLHLLPGGGGPRFHPPERYFAAKVGVLRWLVRHAWGL